MRANRFLTRWTGRPPATGPGGPAGAPVDGPAGDGPWAAETATDGDRVDAELVTALRTGTPQAARLLYDTYGQALYGFAYRRTGDAELSKDLVQDVMVRVWQAAPRFDPSLGTFRSWVFRIARNALTDEIRRAARRPRVVGPLDWNDREDAAVSATTLAGMGEPATDDVEAFLRSWLIGSALDRLPTDHRAVVELVYLRQLKISEAAQRLGVPEGTVKSRCFYALQNLRTAFQELGVVQHDL